MGIRRKHDDDDSDDELSLMPARVVFALGNGAYLVALPDPFRELLARQLEELRGSLMSEPNDPKLQRLFPTAYADDPELDQEYQRLMRSELMASRLSALDTFEQTLAQDELSEDELLQWMQSVNALRLAIGTLLDVGVEHWDLDDNDPRVPAYALYEWLGALVYDMLVALRAGGAVDDAGRS